jgi:hypothetical protein
MAWTVVQNTGTFNATAGTSLAVAFGSNVTAGNRIIVLGIALGGSATTATLSATDTRSTPYSAIATTLATHATALFRCQVIHGLIATSGACTVTFTLSASANERVMMIAEVSGLSGSTSGVVATTGLAANPSGNMTISATSSLMIGGMATGGSGTQGTGFTLLTTQDGNVGEYRIPAGTGTQALSFTEAASNDFAVFGAEFLASATAATVRANRMPQTAVFRSVR